MSHIEGEDEVTDMGNEPLSADSKGKVRSSKVGPDSKGRSVKVRKMPESMAKRWADVASCLLTLKSGKQVLFVRGAQ